jgi:hypothetical protein
LLRDLIFRKSAIMYRSFCKFWFCSSSVVSVSIIIKKCFYLKIKPFSSTYFTVSNIKNSILIQFPIEVFKCCSISLYIFVYFLLFLYFNSLFISISLLSSLNLLIECDGSLYLSLSACICLALH